MLKSRLQRCLIQIMHCVTRIMKSCESSELPQSHLSRILGECDLNQNSFWLESQDTHDSNQGFVPFFPSFDSCYFFFDSNHYFII